MGMNLQSVLEPQLNRLWQAAEDMYKGAQPYDADPAQVQQGLDYLAGDLTDLLSKFRSYYTLDGADLEPTADAFATKGDEWALPTGASVYCALARAAGHVNEVGKLIDHQDWMGGTATAFYNNFLQKFPYTALAHARCAVELAIAARTLGTAVELIKGRVVWICKAAIQRLGGGGDPGKFPGEDEEVNNGPLTAILADSVALLLALAAPEIEGLDAGLAATGVVGGLYGESKAPRSKEKPMGVAFGNTVHEVVQNTFTALTNLDSNIAGLDEEVAEGLEKDLTGSGVFNDHFTLLADPGVTPAMFSKLTGRGWGGPFTTDADDLVITSVVRLYYAGAHSMPDAVDQYSSGAQTCRTSQIDLVDQQFPRSVPKFNEGAAILGKLMTGLETELENAGKAIVAAATDYHYADATEAAEIKRLEAQIPTRGSNFAQTDNYTPPAWLA
jgi:hypothetical protein